MRRSLVDLFGLSTNALFAKAVAAQRAERWEEAVTCVAAVLERLRASPRHDEIEAGAMNLKAVCLHKQGYARATIAACDSLIARHAGSDDPVTVGFVADALWIKGRALAECGESERERAVLSRLIAEFGDHPRARSHVARAMYTEGMYLRNSGRGEEAMQVWDELFSRFGTRSPSEGAHTCACLTRSRPGHACADA